MAKSHGSAIAEPNLAIAAPSLYGSVRLLDRYGCRAEEAEPKPRHATPWQHYWMLRPENAGPYIDTLGPLCNI